MAKCTEKVFRNYSYRPCYRNATHGDKCFQHSEEGKRERALRSEATYEKNRKQSPYYRLQEMTKQRDELLACIQRIAKLQIVEVEEIVDDYIDLIALITKR